MLHWMQALAQTDGLTIILTTHHPHHALVVADTAMLMFEDNDYLSGEASDILNETNLMKLYGVALKRVAFDYEGQTVETLAPILTHTPPAGAAVQRFEA